MRRNRVPESVSTETPKAKKAEDRRRRAIRRREAAERNAEEVERQRLAQARQRKWESDIRAYRETGKVPDRQSLMPHNPNNVTLKKEHLEQLREEVTPTDAAGRAYAQSGNVLMAGAMGGLKTAETFGPAKASGQMGGGNPLKGVLPKHPGKNLGARGAVAGYVAEKTGKSVSEVLTGHGRLASPRNRVFERRSAEHDASLTQAEQMRTELRMLVDGSATSKDSPSKQMAKLVAKLSPYGLQAVRDGVGSFITNTDAGHRYAQGRLGQLQTVLAKRPRSTPQIEQLNAGDPTVGIPGLYSVSPMERARIIDRITGTGGISPASAYRAFLETIGDALHHPQWNEAKGTYVKPKSGELIYPFMFGGTVGANVEIPAWHPRSIERPVLSNLKNWFIDGIIAASVKRMGQDVPSTLKAAVMDRSGNASEGLRSAIQSRTLTEKELVDIASEKPWLVRDRIDSGNASPSLKRRLMKSPDLAVRALASRFPGTTAEELRNLHETYHVPLSAIQKEFPWAARRDRTKGDAAIAGHLKFFADHLDSLREGPLKSLALKVAESGKRKAAIVPQKTINVYDTMPADDLESFVPPGHTPQEALEWMSKQTERRFTGLPDIGTLLKLAKRTDISAQERADLIREADESLYEQFRAGKADFIDTPAGLAVSMLDALNLREAWAARTPASGKRSPAAEENRRMVGELQAAGLDLREMNERWLDALSMGKYGAAAQKGAPWLVQRRRTLSNAVADFTAYPTPLSAASAAITLHTESPGHLGAGFDYSHDSTPHFRVNYLMRPGSMTLGPSIQGYWTDAGTGMSGYRVPSAVQNRRAGYEALSRLKLLGARHGPQELSDRISGRLHSIPPTSWTGPSDSPTFPFSLAARYLGDRARTLQVSGARRFKFGEINIEKDIPRESTKDYIGAIELVRRGKSGEPSADEYDYVQQLRGIAQDYGIDLIESKSDHFHPATADLALPTETEVHRDPRFHHQDAKGGDAGNASDTRSDTEGGEAGPPEDIPSPGPGEEVPSVSPPAGDGPRIVINPSTFRNDKDALCVAFNEAFRIVMEEMGFNPVAEPTEAQRKFFSDTAYADDELQMRRTILARICTFDTSVKDPTDEQLQEAVEFLTSVMEAGAPQNDWEQQAVTRLRDVLARVSENGVRAPEGETREGPHDRGAVTGAIGGGDASAVHAAERNGVPRSVSAETPAARAAENRRRLGVDELRRAGDRPSMSAVTPLRRKEWDEERDRARFVQTPLGIRFPVAPKEQWDRMVWEERDAVLRAARQSLEAALMAAVPKIVEAPGLQMSKTQMASARRMFGDGVMPEKVARELNHALVRAHYAKHGVGPPMLFGDNFVVNSPDLIARKLTDLGGELSVGNLVENGVFRINATPWEHMSKLEQALWKEEGHLPLSSIYFYRGSPADPAGRFRGATHWSSLRSGTPSGDNGLNLTVGPKSVSEDLSSKITVGARSADSSFTLIENAAAKDAPLSVRPKLGNYYGKPLAGGQVGGYEPWVHEDAKGGKASKASEKDLQGLRQEVIDSADSLDPGRQVSAFALQAQHRYRLALLARAAADAENGGARKAVLPGPEVTLGGPVAFSGHEFRKRAWLARLGRTMAPLDPRASGSRRGVMWAEP